VITTGAGGVSFRFGSKKDRGQGCAMHGGEGLYAEGLQMKASIQANGDRCAYSAGPSKP